MSRRRRSASDPPRRPRPTCCSASSSTGRRTGRARRRCWPSSRWGWLRDLLTDAPPGAGALALVLAAEVVRALRRRLARGSFCVEWLVLAGAALGTAAVMWLLVLLTFAAAALPRRAVPPEPLHRHGLPARWPSPSATGCASRGARAEPALMAAGLVQTAGAPRRRRAPAGHAARRPAARRPARGRPARSPGACASCRSSRRDRYRLLAEENRINMRLIAPARGQLFDRNGAPLAINTQNYRVVMVREQAGDAEAMLDKLAELIDIPELQRQRMLKEIMQKPAFVPVGVAEHLSWEDFSQGQRQRARPARHPARGRPLAALPARARHGACRRLCRPRHPARPRRAGDPRPGPADPRVPDRQDRRRAGARGRSARPCRHPPDRGQRRRPRDPRARAQRGRRRAGSAPDARPRAAEVLPCAAGRRERGDRADGHADRRRSRRRIDPVLRPEPVRARHLAGRLQRAADEQSPPAAQQVGVGHVPAGLDLQGGRGAGGARGRDHGSVRHRLLPGPPQARQAALPLLAPRRARLDEHARCAGAILRRLLLRDSPPRRHREDRRDGEPPRPRRRARPASVLHARRADPDAGLEARDQERGTGRSATR